MTDELFTCPDFAIVQSPKLNALGESVGTTYSVNVTPAALASATRREVRSLPLVFAGKGARKDVAGCYVVIHGLDLEGEVSAPATGAVLTLKPLTVFGRDGLEAAGAIHHALYRLDYWKTHPYTDVSTAVSLAVARAESGKYWALQAASTVPAVLALS
jgi:hypothetical protein